jgi:hypothetical protein
MTKRHLRALGLFVFSLVSGAALGIGTAATVAFVSTGDTGTVTNTMLAGSIAAAKLVGTDIATVGTVTAGTLAPSVINQEAHVLTTGFSVTGTGLTTFVGLDQSFTAAGLYSCNGHIHFTTAPTSSNGFKVALASDGTSSITTLEFYAEARNAATPALIVAGSATALGSTAFGSTLAMTDVMLSAVINVNVAGVIHVQGAENAASGTVAATAGNARWDCLRAS